jgi:hypothetical protein
VPFDRGDVLLEFSTNRAQTVKIAQGQQTICNRLHLPVKIACLFMNPLDKKIPADYIDSNFKVQ